jgi:PKD repeat protein/subtilisin-like proprotein convertase family protein
VQGGLTSSITVGDAPSGEQRFILDVDVQFEYSHSSQGNDYLVLDLISPSGKQVYLAYSAHTDIERVDAIFDDQGVYAEWTEGPLNVSGNVIPTIGGTSSYLLDQYDGEQTNGTWALNVNRGGGGKAPVVESWSLIITYGILPSGPPNQPPTADAGAVQSGDEDALLTFDASGSSDPDGDPLTYLWDFGDGQSTQTNSPMVSHVYAYGGSFDVTLTVDDGRGGVASSTTAATVTEVNDLPLADAGGAYSGFENAAITFDASGSSDFDNLDGFIANDQVLEYTWDFGDGTVLTTTDPTVDHTYTTANSYSVSLTVSDGIAVSTADTATVMVDVQPAGNANDIYVWNISSESASRGKHLDYRIVVDVHRDYDADGSAGLGDVTAADVFVTVQLRSAGGSLIGTYSGYTDSSGSFRSGWIRGLSSGDYRAEVVDMVHASYSWNQLLDPTPNDDDYDGDGLPDDLLIVT